MIVSKMILRTVVLSIFYISSIHTLKLHEHMTKQEIEAVFNCKHDEVHKLEYEVVTVLHKDNKDMNGEQFEKSSPTIELEAFNQSYTLYIENNNHVLYGSNTPVYIAKQDPSLSNLFYDNVVYNEVSYPFLNVEAYHDTENRAALTIHRDANNSVHVDGLIGDDLVIRSLPTRIHEEVLNKYPDLYPPADYKYTRHTVWKHARTYSDSNWSQFQGQIRQIDDNPFGFPTLPPLPSLLPFPPSSLFPTFPPLSYGQNTYNPISAFKPTTASPPTGTNYYPPIHRVTSPAAADDENTVYPQIMIVIDYETYITHGSNLKTILKYVVAFWNAVDLRYRELQDPKVRLNIAAIIIAEESNGAPYMERNIGLSGDMLSAPTSTAVTEYFRNQNVFLRSSYDAVIAMTSRPMDGGRTYGRVFDLNTICTANAVGLVSDYGGFGSITTGAHELAHILGAYHDFQARTELGQKCPDGFLMSYNRHDYKGLHWSECSISALRRSMKSSRAMCLKNKPFVGTPYRKVLPGLLLSRDEQCRKSYGNGYTSLEEAEKNCVALFCIKITVETVTHHSVRSHFEGTDIYESIIALKPPAEGSSCSEGGICLDGQCVRVPREFNKYNHLAP